MGGYGSGRQGGRPTTGGALALDLTRLHPGRHAYSWSMAGQRVGSVTYELNAVSLVVSYARTDDDGQRREHNDRLALVSTPAGFGGERRWLMCPCGRRCRVVYVGRSGTRCRRCYRLAYQSQRESLADRAQRRAAALARLAGADAGAPFDWFPPKPKRMHWSRYWRLEAQHSALIDQVNGSLMSIILGKSW